MQGDHPGWAAAAPSFAQSGFEPGSAGAQCPQRLCFPLVGFPGAGTSLDFEPGHLLDSVSAVGLWFSRSRTTRVHVCRAFAPNTLADGSQRPLGTENVPAILFCEA
jgi:hypothetical protein